MRAKLFTGSGTLHPPEFTDGHGPIGAYAMLGRTPEQARALRFCKQAFDSFVAQLRATMTPEQWPEFDRLVWVNAESSYHTCVSVFHEHPSLLTSEAEKQAWRPVQGELRTRLAAALRDATAHHRAPQLTLDSLCLTADGAFIAGFVDDDSRAFAALREATATCARDTIGGELTSRPKSLIHVTLGRVLGAPADLSDAQRARVAALVHAHNDEVLPRMVAAADCPRTMRVGGLSLVRDRVWVSDGPPADQTRGDRMPGMHALLSPANFFSPSVCPHAVDDRIRRVRRMAAARMSRCRGTEQGIMR